MTAKSRTAKYFASNPAARKRRLKAQAETNRKPEEKKKRRKETRVATPTKGHERRQKRGESPTAIAQTNHL